MSCRSARLHRGPPVGPARAVVRQRRLGRRLAASASRHSWAATPTAPGAVPNSPSDSRSLTQHHDDSQRRHGGQCPIASLLRRSYWSCASNLSRTVRKHARTATASWMSMTGFRQSRTAVEPACCRDDVRNLAQSHCLLPLLHCSDLRTDSVETKRKRQEIAPNDCRRPGRALLSAH